VVLVWGMDKEGQQIKAVITCATERMARCAIAQGRFELGSMARFWITATKSKEFSRFLEIVRAVSPIHQGATSSAPVLQPGVTSNHIVATAMVGHCL